MRTVFEKETFSPCFEKGRSSEPGACRRCGKELVLSGDPQRICSSSCRHAIAALPINEREAVRRSTPFGLCVGCGSAVAPPLYKCPSIRRRQSYRIWRKAAGGRTRFGAEAFEWLSEKLGLRADDDRLPEIALALARSGKLTVFTNGGRVIGIAKTK